MAKTELSTAPSSLALLSGLVVGIGGLAGVVQAGYAPVHYISVTGRTTASSQAGSAGDADRILERLRGERRQPTPVDVDDEVWAHDVADINVDLLVTGPSVRPNVRMATDQEILDLYRPSEDSWSSL